MDCLIEKSVQLGMGDQDDETKDLETISAAVQSFLENGEQC